MILTLDEKGLRDIRLQSVELHLKFPVLSADYTPSVVFKWFGGLRYWSL